MNSVFREPNPDRRPQLGRLLRKKSAKRRRWIRCRFHRADEYYLKSATRLAPSRMTRALFVNSFPAGSPWTSTCGFDQIVNNMATYHYRTAGDANMNVVIRGPAGAYGGGALYHSQMNEAWFCNAPGIKVVCPSTPYDAKGLMKSALRDGNPVLFYEIKQLYRDNHIAEVLPEEDYVVPFGSARIRREGSDVTFVTYGNNVYHCMTAAKKLADEGIEAEVIDIRSLVPLDEESIVKSIAKTNRVVVVNEAPKTCGFAGEIVARISDLAFEYLDAPPIRVTRMDTPVPWAKPLELYVLPSVDKIVAAAHRVLRF